MRAPYGWPGCPLKEPVALLSSGRYVAFQMAEIAVSRPMVANTLSLIARLRAKHRSSALWCRQAPASPPSCRHQAGL